MNKIKKFICIITCVAFILTMCLSTFAYSESTVSTDSSDSYQFTDSQNNIIKLARETDNTINVYVNGELNHSAKTDFKNDTVEYIEYGNSNKGDNEGKKNNDKKAIKSKKILKASSLFEEIPSEELEDSKRQDVQDILYSLAAVNEAFPYSEGWSYVTTYTHDTYPGYPCVGYKKVGGTTKYSEKKVSFIRSMAIGVAVSLLLSIFTGGISLAVGATAILGCAGAYVVDGLFTQDVDVYAHYEIKWENWLARINNHNFYQEQGTYYIVITEPNTHNQSLTEADGKRKAGFIWDMNEFLRITIISGEWLTTTPPAGTGDLGDVNGDGSVNSTDYALVKRHILGTQELNGEGLANADVNKDGSVNSTDYALIKRFILGTISKF